MLARLTVLAPVAYEFEPFQRSGECGVGADLFVFQTNYFPHTTKTDRMALRAGGKSDNKLNGLPHRHFGVGSEEYSAGTQVFRLPNFAQGLRAGPEQFEWKAQLEALILALVSHGHNSI